MFICFIDYTKAFGRVKYNKLIKVLEKYDIPQEEIRLISDLHWKTIAVVRTTNGESRGFKIKKGVRQGCILSPILFNMYSEELIREALDDTRGKKVNSVTITNNRYADDTIIIAETEDDLQLMITRLNETCKIYGMELNAKKTKVIVIEKYPGTKIQITSGKFVSEQVKSYCYLGSQIK